MVTIAMRPYSVLSDNSPDPFTKVSHLYVTATLEMVLRDTTHEGMVLRLHSYPSSSEYEGYWAPPNLQYKVEPKDEAPPGREEVLEAFDHYQKTNARSIKEDIERLAESFGLRGVEVERVGSSLVEAKPSINNPEITNAFSTMRFVLTKARKHSYANLVDPDGRYGFVVLPLPADPSDPRIRIDYDPNGTGKKCRFFLGKPVISGLNMLLDDVEAVRNLHGHATDVSKIEKHRTQFGLLAAADIAGYGEALQVTLMGLLSDPEVERSTYRRRVLGALETALTAMGSTQVQSAGDGFVAGYPCTGSGSVVLAESLDRILRPWTATLRTIANEINPVLTGSSKLQGLGSRMAIDAGVYQWGRINGIGSFFPSFDGSTVITAARMEQALNQSMIDPKMAALQMEDGRTVTLRKQGHYLALSPAVAMVAETLSGTLMEAGWTLIGRCVLESKKLVIENVLVLEWKP